MAMPNPPNAPTWPPARPTMKPSTAATIWTAMLSMKKFPNRAPSDASGSSDAGSGAVLISANGAAYGFMDSLMDLSLPGRECRTAERRLKSRDGARCGGPRRSSEPPFDQRDVQLEAGLAVIEGGA